MAPRTRAEKEQFFADLARLDDLDDDSDEDCVLGDGVNPRKEGERGVESEYDARKNSGRRGKVSLNRKRRTTPPKNERGLAVRTSESVRILGSEREKERVRVDRQLDPLYPNNVTVADSPPTRHLAAAPAGEPARPSTANEPISEGAPKPALRRTQTERAHPRDQSRRKKTWRETDLPAKKQIFAGLSFFFIPNSSADPVQAFRIQNAIARGAALARSWEGKVTHVIICSDLHIQRAARELPLGKLPDAIPTVKENWVVECVRFGELLDVARSRFRVPGMKGPYELDPSKDDKKEKGEGQSMPNVRSHSFAESPETRRTLDNNEEMYEGPGDATSKGKGKVSPEYHDDLDSAIEDVKKIGDLPTDLLDDEQSSFSGMEPALMDDIEGRTCPPENAGFQCMEKHDGNIDNPNARTIELLQNLSVYYDQVGDKWRTLSYRKACAALRKQETRIRTEQEAGAVSGIGPRIAAKIEEIVITDRLRRLEYAFEDPMDQVLRLFMGVYGAGYAQAQRWISQGHRCLDDLRTKADLTANQKIGVERYDDFKQQISREEVEQHAGIVKRSLRAADKGLEMIVGGSFRRGNKDSGDIDIIITKKDASMEHVRTLVMGNAAPRLTEEGFFKATLASGRDGDSGSKWHGASCLPGSKIWRRLDLLFVPWSELGAALIYFTGNDIFNRSMRLLASRKGMRLNQHGLFKNVMRGRGRQKITEGELMEGHNERRIFEILGVPYRPPEHRKC